jgi:hypothetical protein
LRWAIGRLLLGAAAGMLIATTSLPAALAGPRQEAIAKGLLKVAKADFVAGNFGIGAGRLQRALKICGEKRCTTETHAALLVGLGAMQLRRGAHDAALEALAAAAKEQPDLAPDPVFDSPELRAVFADASGTGGAGDSEGRAVPRGDFSHTPPTEQVTDTPLPLYLEGGPDSVARVVVEYRPESSTPWKSIDLEKKGRGWAGLVPCGDVHGGDFRYYVTGLDEANTPVAHNGDPKHSYVVLIKDAISGDAPHLPSEPPPGSCGQHGASDQAGGTGESPPGGESPAGDEGSRAAIASKPARRFKRLWLGVGAELELMKLPVANDVCALNRSSGLPSNGSNLYCTTQAGADFPARTVALENYGLCTAAQVASGLCPSDAGGRSSGALVHGDLRLMASVEYAFTANLLVGLRGGVTLFPYPGQAAVNDRRDLGSRIYGEVRGTFVFGANALGSPGLKPLVLLGVGVASFEGHASSAVAFCPAALPAGAGNPCGSPLFKGPVNVWQTNGPGFGTVGLGLRWVATESIAFTLAARLNVSSHQNGWLPSFLPLVPTFGPELAAQYGF